MGHAKKERAVLFGTDQRITSGPAARRLHSKAGYMAAPERFADLSDSSCTAGAVHTWPNAEALRLPHRGSFPVTTGHPACMDHGGDHLREGRLS
jgi:hypothetical protein